MNELAKAVGHPQTWTLKIRDQDLLATLRKIRIEGDLHTFESRTKVGGYWCLLRANIRSKGTKARVWVWPIPGDTDDSRAMIPREELRIVSYGSGPEVDCVIEREGGFILQGQGRAVQQFDVDFATGESVNNTTEIAWPNPYAPSYPNQTGGLWAYMGTHHPAVDEKLLYQLGGYAGYFLNPDGTLLTEAQKPDLQAGSHIHQYSKDPGWIDYTDRGAPWRDRMIDFQVNQDAQHLCLWSPLADTLVATRNEGLRMLAEAAVHVTMRLLPVKSRGTTHDQPGAERAQGRISKTCVDLWHAFAHYQDAGAQELARLIAQRGAERWELDKQQFIKLEKETGIGFMPFGKPGRYSVGEIGINFWGKAKMRLALDKLGASDALPGLNIWMDRASKFCFDQWRFYDIPGDRRWAYPYYNEPNGIDSGPASSCHFAWLAAMHYEPRNEVERDKWKAIQELGWASYDERFTKLV